MDEKKLWMEELGMEEVPVMSNDYTWKAPIKKTLKDARKIRLDERELEKIAPSTGYSDLDRLIKGFIPGHLYTLTGETNVGKSSLASNFTVAIAKQHKKVLYVSLEPDSMIVEYIASVYHDKRFDDLTPDDLQLDEISVDILDKEDVSSDEEMVKIIEAYDRYDLVIIDHIGYFITSQSNQFQQQSNAIKRLVGIAKKKKCAVMIVAHLRKRGKNDKKDYVPTSDDISGSGAFKQDSTDVLIATRDIDKADEDKIRYTNTGKLYVVKTKSGPNGCIHLGFSDRKAKITSDGENDFNNLVATTERMFNEPVESEVEEL